MLTSERKTHQPETTFTEPYLLLTDHAGKIITVSERAFSLLNSAGISRPEHSCINDILALLDKNLNNHPIFDNGFPGSFEIAINQQNKPEFSIHFICTSLKDECGPQKWQLTGMDIRNADTDVERSPGSAWYQSVMNLPAPMWIYDVDSFAFVMVNEAATRVYGYSQEEFFGMTVLDIRPVEAVAEISELIKQIDTGAYSSGQVFTHTTKTGERVNVKVSSCSFPLPGRKCRLVLAENVNDAVNLEKEKFVSDTIINSLPGIFYLFDENGRFLRWNKRMETVSGYSAEEIANLSPLDFFGADEKAYIQQRIQTGFIEGVSDAEAFFLTKDGRRIPYYFTGNRLELNGGRFLTGSGIDITALRVAEKQLKAYSSQITEILYSITDGFFTLRPDFTVAIWNHEAEKMLGIRAEHVVDQVLWDALPSLRRTAAFSALNQAMSRHATVVFEQFDSTTDCWLEMSVYPSTQGLFVYIKNITVRKKQNMLLSLEKKVLELNSFATNSLQTTINHFLSGIEQLYPGMRCSVLLLDEKQCMQHLSSPNIPSAFSAAVNGLPIGPMEGSCGAAMFEKKVIITEDVLQDPRWEKYRSLARQFNIRACWSLPILDSNGTVLGTFATYLSVPKKPGEEEQALVERAASFIKLIIENKLAADKLRLSNDRYAWATKAANDIIWDWDIENDISYWSDNFYMRFGYPSSVVSATKGFWDMHIHPDDRERVIKSITNFVQEKTGERWVEEYRFEKADGNYVIISDRGFLISNDDGEVIRMIGSMQDVTEKREMEKELLKQEIDRQKLVARAMIDTQEKERAEIGKELHDNVNQILSTTKLYLELAKSRNSEQLMLINRSAENLHHAINEIRHISRSLAPPSLGDLGLVDSLYDLVESIRFTKALNVEFYPSGLLDEQLSDKHKLMLFRITQEQVNNVLKHAGAKNLTIELLLEETENCVELNIADDGKGFDPEKVNLKKSIGLSNIFSRADLFGGKVSLVTAPGNGCKLHIKVPLTQI